MMCFLEQKEIKLNRSKAFLARVLILPLVLLFLVTTGTFGMTATARGKATTESLCNRWLHSDDVKTSSPLSIEEKVRSKFFFNYRDSSGKKWRFRGKRELEDEVKSTFSDGPLSNAQVFSWIEQFSGNTNFSFGTLAQAPDYFSQKSKKLIQDNHGRSLQSDSQMGLLPVLVQEDQSFIYDNMNMDILKHGGSFSVRRFYELPRIVGIDRTHTNITLKLPVAHSSSSLVRDKVSLNVKAPWPSDSPEWQRLAQSFFEYLTAKQLNTLSLIGVVEIRRW